MNQNKNLLSDKQNLAPLMLCIGGIAVNILFSKLVSLFDLPVTLYLDSIGTVIAAVLGGTLPGVIVGFGTNIVLSISNPSTLYYGIINVLIAIAASHMGENKKLKKPLGIAALIMSLALIAGTLGTLIPWFMESLTFDGESISKGIFQTGYFSSFLISYPKC